MENQLEQQEQNTPMMLNNQMKKHLYETAKWTNFLSLVGLVGIAILMVLSIAIIGGFISLGEELSAQISRALIGVIYFLITALYAYPTIRLLQFSRNLKRGLLENDEDIVTTSFQNLKSVFKFLGILTLILICIYAFIFLMAIVSKAFLN